ncbi:periplasmic binding protein-like I [Hesseltinella vesiculosa]|uniref:Periplasmic binding protein-like I n=1 Tax=Hesseltinella vesiculosa TaxID=101127 RepID=A0A1X2GUS1_9FUNG|nr:periplasmic binding protein-like I [Hesseltinella vesiculosa]
MKHVYVDSSNNFTFTVARKNGTAYISPLNTAGLVELKIGVLLPFHQHDNEWTKMVTLSGISAIRLAVAEINTQRLIPGAYISLIEQDSFPKEIQGQAAIGQAIYSAVSLIHEGIIAMIGDITSSWTSLSALMTSTLGIPQCSFTAIATSLSDKSQYTYFFRTIQTELLYSDAALSFVLSQGWPMMGILYSDDDSGKQLAQDIMMKARNNGIVIRGYQSFPSQGASSEIRRAMDSLIGSGTRVVFVATTGDVSLTTMVTAANAGYISNDYVWLTISMDTDALYHQVQKFNNFLPLRSNLTAMPNITDPMLGLAKWTSDTSPIDFNRTFAGGIFNFFDTVVLPGYPPYDHFVQKWAALDPKM